MWCGDGDDGSVFSCVAASCTALLQLYIQPVDDVISNLTDINTH